MEFGVEMENGVTTHRAGYYYFGFSDSIILVHI
jgi:hypothetical protein